MNVITRVFVMAGAAFALAVTGSATAAAATDGPGAAVITCYSQIQLINDGAGRVWDIEGGSTADQAPIQMYIEHPVDMPAINPLMTHFDVTAFEQQRTSGSTPRRLARHPDR